MRTLFLRLPGTPAIGVSKLVTYRDFVPLLLPVPLRCVRDEAKPNRVRRKEVHYVRTLRLNCF